MTLDELERRIAGGDPPPDVGGALRALWLDARGDWHGAHRAIQDESGEDPAWVHAYLHRKEGDLANAGYWYRRAGRDLPTDPLASEWARLAAYFTGCRTDRREPEQSR